MDKEKLKKILIKADKLQKGKEIATAKELTSIEEKLDTTKEELQTKIDNIELKKGDTGEQGIQGEKGEQGVQGIQGEQGEKGDKGDTGATGKQGDRGIDGLNGKDGLDGQNGLPGVNGSPDTSTQIKYKLETLTGNSRLDSSAIKGLDKLHTDTLNRAVAILDQRTQFLINKIPTPSAPSGGTWGTITGILSDQTDLQTALNAKEDTITGAGANTVWHGNKVFSAVVEADITLSDNTTNDVSTSKHGLMSKLPGTTTIFYRGDGTFAAPAGATVPNAYIIQAFANTTYNLVHNLGSYPVVQVLDSTGAMVIPLSIVHNTANDLTVTFTTTGTYTIIATLGSPQLQNFTSTAIDYTALVTDRIIEVTGASKTVTLPTANVTNVGYEYKIDNSSSGAIFVVGEGGETIQGEATQTLPPNSCMSVYANGTVWRID